MITKPVVLNLNPQEARVLGDILDHIGGDPTKTRGIVDGLRTKLYKQGKKFYRAKVNLTKQTANSSIYYHP